MQTTTTQTNATAKPRWQEVVARYATPDMKRSVWMVINTLVPFFILWYLMIRSVEFSYWLTLLLAIPTAGFMVRTFIIFHDCGHGSFFKSRKANDWLGIITGLINFTPYYRWRHDHAVHHATASDLDRRGVGDIYTMTVKEYLDAPWWKKFGYRVSRNPIVMFLIGPLIVFVITQRIALPGTGKRETASVWWTNLALTLIVGLLCWLVGWQTYVLVQLPVMVLAMATGVWLFYVQHNFDPTYWQHQDQWEFLKAGLDGSSFYKLPAVLQWFTGNIGFHHIHHLSPKIPNYKLPECHQENDMFQVKPLTLLFSLKSLKLRLWDEDGNAMVGWSFLKQYRQNQEPA
ncbi:MAG TPA: fatty acid desaturase [Anaerolineales bacterium]|jgi:omega-6 fatty acid desaturase (delta-12 desaturase)